MMNASNQWLLAVPGLESPLRVFALQNARGTRVEVCELGASLMSVSTADRDGGFANVLLRYGEARHWLANPCYLGVTVGRVANRIGGARFTQNGRSIRLSANEGGNHLHGGREGLSGKRWRTDVPASNLQATNALTFHCSSADGEGGYPGHLEVSLTYRLSDDDALTLDYRACCDQASPVSLTNHAYWNLAGAGDILDHQLQINADHYLALDAAQIPTGQRLPVAGSPLDFRQRKAIGRDIGQLPGGYDHYWVLDPQGASGLKAVATLVDPGSGRRLAVSSTEPGVQFYSGNFLDGSLARADGTPMHRHAGLCLESHGFPDAVNHSEFPSITLEAGQTYRQTTSYQFSLVDVD